MAKRSPLILFQADDLDLWEVVNPSDGEFSDDSFSVDSLSDDDVISLGGDDDDNDDDASIVRSSVISPLPQTLPVADGVDLPVDLDLDGHVDDGGDDVVVRDEDDLGWDQRQILYGYYVNDDGEEDRGGEDVEYDDSHDLDDELVPRSVSKKLGRQRMRKLGKRATAKMYYASKMSLCSHLKHGCVRGKRGFGMIVKC